jgi:hypothetical protein
MFMETAFPPHPTFLCLNLAIYENLSFVVNVLNPSVSKEESIRYGVSIKAASVVLYKT